MMVRKMAKSLMVDLTLNENTKHICVCVCVCVHTDVHV